MFVLNIVKSHHLQLMCCPPLFNNFRWLNINTATTHYSIFQNGLDELLAKGAIEPSPGGADFYLKVFVVPKHTGYLQPIKSLYTHTCF